MDPLGLLKLQSIGPSGSNGSEKHTYERGTGGAAARGEALDGRDGDEHIPGSEVIAKSLRLIDDDLHSVVSKLRSSLQDAHAQLVQSEETCRALYQENTELKRALASHLNHHQKNSLPQFDVDRVFKAINTPKFDSKPFSNAASNPKYMPSPTKSDNGITNVSMLSPQHLQPAVEYIVGTSEPPYTPIQKIGSVQNMRFETSVVDSLKLLNSMITEGASDLSKSIVSVALNPTNTSPPSKDPEWQAALQVTISRLGRFLANTIAQESQKPRLTLNAQLIHITLSAFFTSLVAEWSGWCRDTRSPSSGDSKDSQEDSSSTGTTDSNRDVETALSEFAKVCFIASWNTNPDWDAAFERQLTSFLSHAMKMGPFIMQHPHNTLPQGSAGRGGDGYRPLFVPAGTRFYVERMDNVHQDKENAEKGARKVASCVGFGLSSGMTHDGTLRVLVKPRVVLESTLFEKLNPPQPVFQPRVRSSGFPGTNSTHTRPRRGWSRSTR